MQYLQAYLLAFFILIAGFFSFSFVSGAAGCKALMPTTGVELEQLQQAIDARDAEIDRLAAGLEAGEITPEDFEMQMKLLNDRIYDDMHGLIAGVKQDLDNRIASVQAQPAVTGNPLIDMGLASVLSIVASITATNRMRDRNRLMRGEKT